MQWLSHGGVVGLLIAEGDGSNPGISGYTARDFRYADLLPDDLSVEVPYGVSIVVELLNDERALIIPSQHDCSTFHEVAAAPLDIADGLMFRTGLRNYPVLYFDLSEVPKNVMINRAEIVVYSDTMTSFGPRVAMVATEIDTAAYAAPYDVLDLEELEAELLPISGAEVCSYTSTEIKIVVTRSIQRYSNSAYEGARGFALTGSEDFLIGFDLYDQDPDFWYTQLNMFGTDAADESKRPRLRVTYTADSELIGGGQ